jgi:hypothetical protein
MMKVTKPRARVCLLLVLLITGGLAPVAQSRWYQFVSPDNDFSVSFPGQPQHKTSGSSPQLELYTFSFGQHTLSFGYQDIVPPSQTSAQRAEALAAAVSAQLQWISANGRLLRHKPLPDGGRELLCQTEMNGRPAFRLLRLYVHGTRLYVLTCTAAERSKLAAPAVMRHFASFRFTR